jgi:tetrahydromethanopterin S-methyltransferase subunit F
MTGAEIALIITASGTLLSSLVGAIVSIHNAFNIQRIEKNTNSISQRNEAIAKELGIVQGVAREKANPS